MVQRMQHFRLDRIPDNLLREPLDYLVADHMRQRKLCNALEALHPVNGGGWPREITEPVFGYLADALPQHISDEECDLFPALRAVSGLDSDAEDLIETLIRNHAVELSLASEVIAAIKRTPPANDETGTPNISRLLVDFSDCLRRHLAIEERMLMPLARKRLTGDAMTQIGRAMAKRRDIDYPE